MITELKNELDDDFLIEKDRAVCWRSLEESLKSVFESCIDVEQTMTSVVCTAQLSADTEWKRRISLMKRKGVPQSLLNLAEKSTEIVKLTDEVAKGLRGLTVTSTSAAYYAPWTGEERKTTDGLETRLRKLDNTFFNENSEAVAAEKTVLACYTIFEKHGKARSNSKVCFNPRLPFMSSRPDGFVYLKPGVPVATIEVKSYGQMFSDKLPTGLVGNSEKGSYTISSGHQWLTQVVVQMLSSRVDLAYLVVVDSVGAMITVLLSLDTTKASRLVRNCWKSYVKTITSLPEDNLEIKERLMVPKKGNPKLRRNGYKKICQKKDKMSTIERTLCQASDNSADNSESFADIGDGLHDDNSDIDCN